MLEEPNFIELLNIKKNDCVSYGVIWCYARLMLCSDRFQISIDIMVSYPNKSISTQMAGKLSLATNTGKWNASMTTTVIIRLITIICEIDNQLNDDQLDQKLLF